MIIRALAAMQAWRIDSCLDFIPATDATNGLLIISETNSDACQCPLGYPGPGKVNTMDLQKTGGTNFANGCSSYTIVHELGHGAGMMHTHARKDRDTYCKVSATVTPKWVPWYKILGPEFMDEPLVGATAQAKATEFYDSVMLYGFDSDMDIGTGWAANPASLTAAETAQSALWKSSAGQRDHLGALDIRTINNKYGCFATKMKQVGGTAFNSAFMHPDQTIGQLVKKLGLIMKVELMKITLWTDDTLSQEHTGQPLTTALSALTTPITSSSTVTIKQNTAKIILTASTGANTLYVDLSWTLQRAFASFAYFNGPAFDYSTKKISKAGTVLDQTKKLSDLSVADGDNLTVA